MPANRFFDPDDFTAHAKAKSLLTTEEVIGALAGHLAQRAQAVYEEQQAEIQSLAARIKQLDATPFSYEGVHESGKAYQKNAFVTFNGALWHASRPTTGVPGDNPAWTLAVKRGRDAR